MAVYREDSLYVQTHRLSPHFPPHGSGIGDHSNSRPTSCSPLTFLFRHTLLPPELFRLEPSIHDLPLPLLGSRRARLLKFDFPSSTSRVRPTRFDFPSSTHSLRRFPFSREAPDYPLLPSIAFVLGPLQLGPAIATSRRTAFGNHFTQYRALHFGPTVPFSFRSRVHLCLSLHRNYYVHFRLGTYTLHSPLH